MLTMGIDIGSTTCKCIILRDGSEIGGRAIVPLGTGTTGPQQVFQTALRSGGFVREDIDRILVTGYGRFSFDEADTQKSEITCHAQGIHYLFPTARTVIDIGGQDIKVLHINERGMAENFVMNDKCAAGTGRFLDVMAGVINVRTEDLGSISMEAENEVRISNTCTVFAESEVISKLSANVRLADLVAGIHTSVATRVASLVFRNGVIKDVAMSGGVALNQGIVSALSRELKIEILVHKDCQFAGAIGAALLAHQELLRQARDNKK